VAAAAAARGQLEVARASASLANAQSGRSQIRAARSGTVLRVLRRVGEVVDGTSAGAVIEFAHLAGLEVDVEMGAAGLAQVAVGANARVVMAGRQDAAELTGAVA
jgi:multidrug resistance efflux pump